MNFPRFAITIVAGGAGLIGSHLCEALLASGAEVICVDNLMTGRQENIARLMRHPRFSLIKADITDPLPKQLSPARLRDGAIFNLACAAAALSGRSGAHNAHLHSRHAQSIAAGGGCWGEIPSRIDKRSLRRSRGASST